MNGYVSAFVMLVVIAAEFVVGRQRDQRPVAAKISARAPNVRDVGVIAHDQRG